MSTTDEFILSLVRKGMAVHEARFLSVLITSVIVHSCRNLCVLKNTVYIFNLNIWRLTTHNCNFDSRTVVFEIWTWTFDALQSSDWSLAECNWQMKKWFRQKALVIPKMRHDALAFHTRPSAKAHLSLLGFFIFINSCSPLWVVLHKR